MLIGMWLEDACLDLRSTIDQSLTIYCLREESLIDLNGPACKLRLCWMNACIEEEGLLVGAMYVDYCLFLCPHVVTSLLCSLTYIIKIKSAICLNYNTVSFQLFHLYVDSFFIVV